MRVHTAVTYRKTLSAEEKEKFAYEIALGYYSPDELRHAFELLPQGFNMYMDSDEIKRLVIVQKRLVDESDAAVRILARRAARKAIDENIKLVSDPDAPARTRMAASKELRDFAAGFDTKAPAETGDGPLIIKTNLDLVGAKGVYTIKREEIEEQLAAEEAGEVHDDLDDLLSVQP